MVITKIVPAHSFAKWLLGLINSILTPLGISPTGMVSEVCYIIVIAAIAIVLGWIFRKIFIFITRKIMNIRFPMIAAEITHWKVIRRCGMLIPPLVFLALIPFAFDSDGKALTIIRSLVFIYFAIVMAMAVNAILGFSWEHYNNRHNTKNLPLKGILDVGQIIVWVITIIIIVSLVLGKSPAALLTGLGAFAAVLMLIFKDSILGLVAGVQLSENDMLRVGDWISVPDTVANGIVIDVSLDVVKIRNWDNTVVMMPPYRLVSTSFVNWRCMTDTGSRHMDAAVCIDTNTVQPCSDALLTQVKTALPVMAGFIDTKLKQRAAGDTSNVFNRAAGVDGTIDTNLGLLRAYLYIYLRQHPYIDLANTLLISLKPPTPQGYPLDIYCYMSTADWNAFEAIKADILEHVAAIAPTFGLSIYAQPSSRDMADLGANPRRWNPYYGTGPFFTPTPKPATNKPSVNVNPYAPLSE